LELKGTGGEKDGGNFNSTSILSSVVAMVAPQKRERKGEIERERERKRGRYQNPIEEFGNDFYGLSV